MWRPQQGSAQLSTRHIDAEYSLIDQTNFGQTSIICDQNPPGKDSPQPAQPALLNIYLVQVYQILGELYSSIQARLMSFDTNLRPAWRSNKDFMVVWVKIMLF